MGLPGALIRQSVPLLVMYHYAGLQRLGASGINPLGAYSTGEVMALDGKGIATSGDRSPSDIALMAENSPC